MGSVYLATQGLAGTQRNVVVKHLIPYWDVNDPHGEAKAQKRFEQEAATLVGLNHPGIPQIYAYFSEGGQNYIVMQFIEGKSLDEGLTRVDDQGSELVGGSYAIEQVVPWGVQLCKVLEYLAGRQPPVVHQDVKPANIIIDNETGEARLVDFGTAMAHSLVPQPGGVGARKSSVYGTDGYAPPEQYEGRSDPKSDVYALAATLYHLLTDDDPRDHPLDFPALSGLDPALRQVLEGALEPEIAKRPSAQQFGQSLRTLISTQGVLAPPHGATTVKVTSADLYSKSNRSTRRPIGRPVREFKPTDRQVVLCFRLENLDPAVDHDHETLALFYAPDGNVFSRRPKDPVRLSAGASTAYVDVFGFRIQGTSKEQQLGQWKAVLIVDNQIRAEVPFQIAPASAKPARKQRPTVVVKPASLDFQNPQFGSRTHPLHISCTGGTTGGRVSASVPWITLSPQAFSGPTDISVTVEQTKIPGTGKQRGEIQIEAATKQVVVVPVSVQVDQARTMDISPTAWSPPRPLSRGDVRQFDLVISGSPDIRGSLVATVPWVRINQYHFTGQQARVLITVDTSGLHSGRQYRGSIEIREDSGLAKTLGLSVQVAAESAPRLTIQPAVVRIARIESRQTQHMSLHIHNAGGGILRGKVRATVSWLKTSLTEFTNDAEVQVTVEGSCLKSGIAYRGIIEVSTAEGQVQQVPIFVAQVVPASRASATTPLTPQQSRMLKGGFALTAVGILLVLLSLPVLLVWPQSLEVPRVLLNVALVAEGIAVVWNLCLWRRTQRHRLSSVTLAGSILCLVLLMAWWCVMSQSMEVR